MILIVFFVLMLIVLAFLGVATEKKWIKIHDNPEVMKLIAVIGVPVLFVILFFLVLFPMKIYSLVAEYGIWYLLGNIAIAIGVGIGIFAIGFSYFRIRRKRGSRVVEELNLKD